MTRTLVILPTYDERDTLPLVLDLLATSEVSPDVLVVDDSSPDGTGELADERADADARVHVLHRAHKTGLGRAYLAGMQWGLARDYDVFVEMDADLSHDPRQLVRLVEATDRADLVVGSRYVSGGTIQNWPRRRRFLSAGGNLYVRALTRLPVHDATSGYRAFRRPVLEELDLAMIDSDGYSFQVEMALRTWWAGFRLTEVPITFVERRFGSSKISRGVVFEAIWRVARWGVGRHGRPLRPHPRSVTVRSQPAAEDGFRDVSGGR